jgi:hypothetical protein
MSNREDKYKNYYEILELEENATLADINRTYKKLTELYSSESMVTDPIEDEFGEEERAEIVNQLEEAYKALVCYVVEKDRTQKQTAVEEEILEDTAEEEEEEEVPEEQAPEPEEEMIIIRDETQEEIEEEEEEILLLEEEMPDEEAIKTMVAPPSPLEPVKPGKPGDIPEKVEEEPIHIHENEHIHEPLHIELPDKDDIKDQELQNNGFGILDGEVEQEAIKKETAAKEKSPMKKGIWDESLFEKDIDDIKKEITKDITKDIQKQLTIAREPVEIVQPPVKEELKGIPVKGRTMRKLREKLGMGIHEMAVKTKIHYKILVNIEKERFSKLPDPGYLRWYLMTYAKELSLDPRRVADEYMRRFRLWEKDQKELE